MIAAKPPATGDMYRCEKCALEIHVTQGCECESHCATFECCGQAMKKVTEPEVQNP
jgi:predicted nucleic acid-binding Zn ribbon protein